jgi:putative heme degradation protein
MAGLRAAWASLGDAAELSELFARRGLTRLQGLRLGGARLAWRVDHALLRLLLETLADWILDVEVSVSNAAATQVHAGPVYQIREAGPWLEIRDEGFRFRICEAAVREAWVVRVPTPRGTMLALELFDGCERLIARMAGPAGGGGADWRRILHALPLVEA